MTPFREETIGEARLIMADCRDVLPTLGSVDVLVTDPPYGVDFKGKATKHTQASKDFSGGYLSGDTDIGPEIVRLALALVQRGVVFPGTRMMFDYPKPYEIGSVYCPSGAGRGRWGFMVFNPMLFYGMGLPHTRQGPSGFESFDTVEDCGHPCPKPLRWMLWAVNKCSLPGQAVLDPFMGSALLEWRARDWDERSSGLRKSRVILTSRAVASNRPTVNETYLLSRPQPPRQSRRLCCDRRE